MQGRHVDILRVRLEHGSVDIVGAQARNLLQNFIAAQSKDAVCYGAAIPKGALKPFALIGAAVWFLIAWAFHQKLIEASVGAKGVTRKEAPEIYNLLENLSIAGGMTMPKLAIIDTDALNAFASGIGEKSYTVTLTRGIVDRLDKSELEAVIAHELTHIRNRDTQMLVIAVIFAGIFAFFGDLAVRRWDFPYGWSPRGKPAGDDQWRAGDARQLALAVAQPHPGAQLLDERCHRNLVAVPRNALTADRRPLPTSILGHSTDLGNRIPRIAK